MSGINGYGAYIQSPLIQERATGQRPQSDQGGVKDPSTGAPNKASREELFRALLKTADTSSTESTTTSTAATRSDPSSGKGQFLDVSV